MEIFPSLISSDLMNLENVIKSLDNFCNGYHIDVMDDHFVPNLTWGPMFVNAIEKVTNLPLHVHLMVENPSKWLDRVQLKGTDIFIFHAEIYDFYELAIDFIKKIKAEKKCKVGVAVNPKTEINYIFNYLKYIDHVLIMSVEPGFSGQKFISEVTKKIEPLKLKKNELKANFTIGMDGGINSKNIKKLSEMGVDQFGIASAIFEKKDPVKELQDLFKI